MKERLAILVLVVGGVCIHSPPIVRAQSGTQVDTAFTNNQAQNTTAIGGGNANSNSNSTSSAQSAPSTAVAANGPITVTTGASTALAGGGTALSQGGSAYAEGSTGLGVSSSSVNIDTTSVSNYQARTPPMTTYPPSLPFWQHGGWGAINAYFPNGPTIPDKVYERVFYPCNPEDMRELHAILGSLPYDGPLQVLGALFSTSDTFHHGRGIEISSSLVRDRRPKGKPLLVFIDTNVDAALVREAGYAYVGRISLEGNIFRNWDHCYHAAVAEALPWDVDILLISGGMKGVSVGRSSSFPGGALGYSQTNYSLSLFGGKANGVTEGKGEAMLGATAYRFSPEILQRREIPQSVYDRIRARPKPVAMAAPAGPQGAAAPAAAGARKVPGVEVSKELYDMAGFTQGATSR